jgi:ABC-2 type transport system permease protein
MTKLDLLAGYGTAFSLAAAQAGMVSFVAFRVTRLHIDGSPLLVLMISVLGAILGVSLGLFFSAFAATEFQAVQFGPIVLVPQLFLAGVIVPRDEMPGWLQPISNVLPLSYAVDAMQQVSTHTAATPRMWHAIGIISVFIVAALLGGAATLQRRTP